MKPAFTADALVQLVHQYYPVGVEKEDVRYSNSAEIQDLNTLLRAHATPIPAWKNFIQKLSVEFSDCSIWDTTVPLHDPCYTCRVSLPGFVTGSPRYDSVVCMLSQLAPVYALYASHLDKTKQTKPEHWLRFPPFPSEFEPHEEKLARLIESAFGATKLGSDLLLRSVRDVIPPTAQFELGEARLVDCLFTAHRW